MTVGAGATRTSATSPKRTWPPPGVSISKLRISLKFPRFSGMLHTTTSNTFCSSNKLPTLIPDNKVAAARRTSPGLMPKRAHSQVDFDFYSGLFERKHCARIDYTWNTCNGLLDLIYFGTQDFIVVAIQAHCIAITGLLLEVGKASVADKSELHYPGQGSRRLSFGRRQP